MVCAMARPWKHPATGIYWYRKVVPAPLRVTLGKRELKWSLGTKDTEEAKRRHREAADRADLMIASARRGITPGGATTLNAQDTMSLGAEWLRRRLMAQQAAPPSEPIGWETMIDALEDADENGQRVAYVEREVEALLRAEGLNLKPGSDSHRRLSQVIFDHHLDFYAMMLRRSEGGAAEVVAMKREAKLLGDAPAWKRPVDGTKTIEWALDRWIEERKPKAKTAYEWRCILKQFGLETTLQGVTPSDVVAFKARWVSADQKPNTVNKKLQALRAVFGWAHDNKHLEHDPTEGIGVAGLKQDRLRKKRVGYTRDEASKLLKAARSADTTNRWITWLLAATGCRIQEVAQAFASDVKKEGTIWTLTVTEAGDGQSLKTSRANRTVPLHPMLKSEGFFEYVMKLPKGSRLFRDIKPDRLGNWGGNVDKTWNRWAKKIVPAKSAHCWRHAFKTALRNARTPDEISNYLMGHAGVGEGITYGEKELPMLAKAVARLKVGAE